MKIIDVAAISGTEREVACPKGGFVSNRILLESDGMGYTLTKTVIPVAGPQFWHYKAHLETCYCIAGIGQLIDLTTGEKHVIKPGIVYALNNHDPHTFEAFEECVLICVFNPPLKGREVHAADGSYGADHV